MTSVPVTVLVRTKASFPGRIRIPQFLFRPVPFAENTKDPRHILDHLPRIFSGESPICALLKKFDGPIQERFIDGALRRQNRNGIRMAVCPVTSISPPILHLVQSLNKHGRSFRLTRTRMP